MLYLVDIDGTLADLTHRLHFIQKKPADWDGFFAECYADAPIYEVIETVKLLASAGARIVLVTGRSDACEVDTLNWLLAQGISHLALYMRKAGDHRPDDIVKAELLEEIKSDWDDEPILGVFEDRQQVVDMYRAKGLRVFQVAEGKF
jgi:hypothetical protein